MSIARLAETFRGESVQVPNGGKEGGELHEKGAEARALLVGQSSLDRGQGLRRLEHGSKPNGYGVVALVRGDAFVLRTILTLFNNLKNYFKNFATARNAARLSCDMGV